MKRSLVADSGTLVQSSKLPPFEKRVRCLTPWLSCERSYQASAPALAINSALDSFNLR
jgi:hypothetical protein